MKSRFTGILSILLCFVMLIAVPEPSYAAKKKSTKARTTATTKARSSKSKSSKSKKKSGTRRKSRSVSSRNYSNSTNYYTDTPIESIDSKQAATSTSKSPASKKDSKRKIKVEKPDLDQIRRVTLDPSSKFYFPKLRKKYEVNDTTMTPEEFRYFYLGYMFQEDYDPYRVSPYTTITEDLRNKATHTPEEIDTITKYAEATLADNPFDLRQMSFLVHVLKEKRKDMRAKIWEYRLENILGAIKSTGTGESVEDAWYVVYPSHEYDMVQLLGYEATDANFIEPGYDYLSVIPDEADTRKRDKSAKGFYFNVIVPQEQYELKHPEEMDNVEGGEFEPEPTAVKAELEELDPDEIPAE